MTGPIESPPRRAIASCLLAVALLCLMTLAPARAPADVFGPLSLVSVSPFQQVEYAHDPDISGNGQYVVFDGSIGNVTGVWRRELLRNEGDQVVGGNLEQVAGGDAELPSVSENGQYVSFTTNEGSKLGAITDGLADLDATHEAPNVYVRDMSKAPGEAGAFTLASALSYEYPAGSSREFEEGHGSEAAGRTALSADGQKVVFVTTATSNLAGPGTPPLQVAVHDLQTGKTELVSVAEDPATGKPVIDEATGQPEPVPLETEGAATYGAVYTKGEGGASAFKSPQPYELPSGVGASISADGSTVAWMGQDIVEQALMLPAETVVPKYDEPLWRRIADAQGEPSEQAPTRRVTGGSDPADPQCAAHPEGRLPPSPSASDPCQGPFAAGGLGIWNGNSDGNIVPQLSADGEKVAFIASAPLVSQGEDFGLGPAERPSDLYVADMQEGLARTQALSQLTELGSGNEARISTDAGILDLGISPDGTQVAFTTKRTVFPLSSPAYASVPAAVPGLAELFDVDLANNTLTRVSNGYEGGAGAHPHLELGREDSYEKEADGALSPSFSDGGETLAFSSTASNFVYGDGNTPPLQSSLDGSDAFVVNRVLFGSAPTPQYVSPAPETLTQPSWQLGATALSLGDGNVLLYVDVPGAGTLSARVSGLVRIQSARSARATRHGRRAARGSARAMTVVERTVATAAESIDASGGELTRLLLTLAPNYRALAAQKGGLSATANLTFAAPGHPALRQSIAVSFVRVSTAHTARRAKKAVVHRKSKGHKG